MTPLAIHRALTASVYAVAAAAAVSVLSMPDAHKDLVALLSTGAIVATFGSAVATLGSLWERDLLERVWLNVDILYKDVLHQDKPWRRWPFLARSGKRRLLDGNIQSGTLSSPEVSLDVGTHIIKIDLPTVLEDFFDLPLSRNFSQLARFRSAASTVFSQRLPEVKNTEGGMSRSDAYMAYECLYDTWGSILSFRLARYATHLGCALSAAGAIATAVMVAKVVV